jgi:hypothetical protein
MRVFVVQFWSVPACPRRHSYADMCTGMLLQPHEQSRCCATSAKHALTAETRHSSSSQHAIDVPLQLHHTTRPQQDGAFRD